MLGLWIFWISVLLISWTYVHYPLLLLAFPKRAKDKRGPLPTDLPKISIVFAAYNEEAVIAEKLQSCLALQYPKDKLSIYVGSDASTDGTDEIVERFAQQHPQIKLLRFSGRSGKSAIINQLSKKAEGDYLLLTDANIIFQSDFLQWALPLFTEAGIGAVGGRISYRQKGSGGISQQEHTYLELENQIKVQEGLRWGCAMGVEGGCYLVAKRDFPEIPKGFFMEDFYVSMHLLQAGKKVLFEPEARAFEDVSTEAAEEYKRKLRISIGNFQNLGRFGHLLISRPFPLGFAFLSHKVLRWCTPFFLLALIASLYFNAAAHIAFAYVSLGIGLILLLSSLAIVLLPKGGMAWLKFPGHFALMNLALLHGFIRYLKGVENNVWQPTKRNQV